MFWPPPQEVCGNVYGMPISRTPSPSQATQYFRPRQTKPPELTEPVEAIVETPDWFSSGPLLEGNAANPLRGPRTWFHPALKDAKIEHFHWHDLRHTFASRLRQKGTKLEDIAEALGHEDLMMSKRYAHLGPKGLHDVVAMLDENPTGPKTGPDQGPTQGDNVVRSVN